MLGRSVDGLVDGGGEGAAGSRIAKKGCEKDAEMTAKRGPRVALGTQNGSFSRPGGAWGVTLGTPGVTLGTRGHFGAPRAQKVDRPNECQTPGHHFRAKTAILHERCAKNRRWHFPFRGRPGSLCRSLAVDILDPGVPRGGLARAFLPIKKHTKQHSPRI